MSFAALEARVNGSVLKHLSNVVAMLDGRQVRGIFYRAYAESPGGMGMAGTAPTFRMASFDVPMNPIGKLLIVNGVTYAIAAHEPDGTGVSPAPIANLDEYLRIACPGSTGLSVLILERTS